MILTVQGEKAELAVRYLKASELHDVRNSPTHRLMAKIYMVD